MSKLIWVELSFAVFLGLFVLFSVIGKTVDVVFAMRATRRERIGRRAFPVISRPVLPHEGDGQGVYVIDGVVERTGTHTRFEVEARSASNARDKALQRGVSPVAVIKKYQPALPVS